MVEDREALGRRDPAVRLRQPAAPLVPLAHAAEDRQHPLGVASRGRSGQGRGEGPSVGRGGRRRDPPGHELEDERHPGFRGELEGRVRVEPGDRFHRVPVEERQVEVPRVLRVCEQTGRDPGPAVERESLQTRRDVPPDEWRRVGDGRPLECGQERRIGRARLKGKLDGPGPDDVGGGGVIENRHGLCRGQASDRVPGPEEPEVLRGRRRRRRARVEIHNLRPPLRFCGSLVEEPTGVADVPLVVVRW